MTSSVTTMVMAEKKVMSPPQMRMEMRAQLRRRRMFAPTKIPKMASASKNSQKMLVMARTDSGKGTPLLSEEMRETACMAISTKMAMSTPNAPNRMATTPDAVTAGWDFGLGCMRESISPLEIKWTGKSVQRSQ